MSSDAQLIDALRAAFALDSDAEVAAFLGIAPISVYFARTGRAKLGPVQRLKVLDRLSFAKGRSLLEQIAPEALAAKIRRLSQAQARALAERRLERQRARTVDAELIELVKATYDFRNDEVLAEHLGFPRSRISMIRTGRSTLGPIPRLKLLRLVEEFDLEGALEALASSEELVALVRAYGAAPSLPQAAGDSGSNSRGGASV